VLLLPTPQAQDAGRQNLGDLVEAFGGGHEVGAETVTARAEGGWDRRAVHATTIAPLGIRRCRDLRRFFAKAPSPKLD
jgi:hypothetical protein